MFCVPSRGLPDLSGGQVYPPLTLRPFETAAWSPEELTPELGAPWGLVEGHQGVVIGARRSYGGRRAGDRGLEETDDAAREVELEIAEGVLLVLLLLMLLLEKGGIRRPPSGRGGGPRLSNAAAAAAAAG